MTVRAKFYVNEITRRKHWDRAKGDVFTVKMTPVTDGSEENKAFYAATPSGSIELGTVNQAAAESLSLDAEFYVDFTPVPKAEPQS